MAATVTFTKALEIVEQLAAKDREKLYLKMKEQRRKVWLAKIEQESEQALKDHKAGKTRLISSPEDIRAYCEELFNANDA